MSKPRSFFEVLFGSKARVRILKFLFRNQNSAFSIKELAIRIQEPPSVVNKEIKNLLEVGLLKIKK
ncbi:MAG: hypothetical protein HYT65_02405 [Candidatus Yanofskybacteria bacterium]|nr:hypothetical protein [Candidatus Yanofskybacteria bacterium]